MRSDNLAQTMRSVDNPVDLFKKNDYDYSMYVFPDEYSHWIEEQRAVKETCTLVDQSYHMSPIYISGPDSLQLFSDIGTNTFENFKSGSPPKAKNVVLCNPDGYMIRDIVLFYLSEDEFISAGTEIPTNWIQYNLEKGDYDASAEIPYRPGNGDSPREFRFQIQGPNAFSVLDEVMEKPPSDLSFFEMDERTINGVDSYILGFGMAEAPGVEIFGPYEHHSKVKDAILEAGEDFGIRQMGSKAYKTNKIGSGWIHQPVPGIYESEKMQDYRQWLGTDGPEAQMSIGGSYYSKNITDYYMDPFEVGQGHLVNFDHDFIGREALETKKENQNRTKVTFVWDEEDVIDVYTSLFQEGDSFKYIDLPDTARQWSLTHYDKILKDEETVGISKYPGYLYYEREMLSLGVIDREYSDPGTKVTLVWGEENSSKKKVERHIEKEINVTVGPSPYVQGRR